MSRYQASEDAMHVGRTLVSKQLLPLQRITYVRFMSVGTNTRYSQTNQQMRANAEGAQTNTR